MRSTGGHESGGERDGDISFPCAVCVISWSWEPTPRAWADPLLISRFCTCEPRESSHRAACRAASGICAQWPERAFRFSVGADGAVLIITAAAGHPRRQVPPAPGPGTARPQRDGGRSRRPSRANVTWAAGTTARRYSAGMSAPSSSAATAGRMSCSAPGSTARPASAARKQASNTRSSDTSAPCHSYGSTFPAEPTGRGAAGDRWPSR